MSLKKTSKTCRSLQSAVMQLVESLQRGLELLSQGSCASVHLYRGEKVLRVLVERGRWVPVLAKANLPSWDSTVHLGSGGGEPRSPGVCVVTSTAALLFLKRCQQEQPARSTNSAPW